jgi:hypothetical protein
MKLTIFFITTLIVASSYQDCCSSCTSAFETAFTGATSATPDNSAPPIDHFCQAIWTTSGSCCNPAQSTIYWNNFSTEMIEQKNSIKTQLENMDLSSIKTKVKIVKIVIEAIKVVWSTKSIS